MVTVIAVVAISGKVRTVRFSAAAMPPATSATIRRIAATRLRRKAMISAVISVPRLRPVVGGEADLLPLEGGGHVRDHHPVSGRERARHQRHPVLAASQ